MLPQAPQRKKRNSSKVNLMISLVFHSAIVIALAYFAAREGFLGEQLKKIAVEMVKEKPPEKPKEPEPEKPKDQPEIEPPKVEVAAPKIEIPPETTQAPPPPAAVVAAPPAFAPAAVDVPSFVFEGGKAVETSSDPAQIYKSSLEYALRSRWNRPENLDDHFFIAEVEVAVDPSGQISNPIWKKNSGNARWDESVRQAIAATRTINRPPPANFPPRVLVRFDVQETTQAFAP